MIKYLGLLILVIGLIVMFNMGVFDNWIDYFKNIKHEKVIQHKDGSYTTIKHLNVFDLIKNK